jgi:hypothetical protein
MAASRIPCWPTFSSADLDMDQNAAETLATERPDLS